MGQEIVYCFKCNTRLVSSDFDKGAAYWVADRPACKACTWALAASEGAEGRPRRCFSMSRGGSGHSRALGHVGATPPRGGYDHR